MTISSSFCVPIIRSAAILLLLMSCSGSAQDDRNRRVDAGAVADTARNAATQPAHIRMTPAASRTDSRFDPSAIWIVSDPTCALILTDSDNRRTSYDPRTGQSVQEIPNSSGCEEYIEAPTDDGGSWSSNQLEINRPASGDYRLTVIGTQAGGYSISVRAYSSAGEFSTWSQNGITNEKNVELTYNLSFDKTSPTPGVISGGFEGEELPGESNGLLSYAAVAGAVTVLPAGSARFALLVFYAPTLVTGTFSAALDDADISNLFNPAAGKHEIVVIPLHASRNVLRLRAADTTATGRGSDEDVLEFVVE